MAYRLKIKLNDGSIIDKQYENEEYAERLYAMALIKGLAKTAEIRDISDNSILFTHGIEYAIKTPRDS